MRYPGNFSNNNRLYNHSINITKVVRSIRSVRYRQRRKKNNLSSKLKTLDYLLVMLSMGLLVHSSTGMYVSLAFDLGALYISSAGNRKGMHDYPVKHL